MAHTPMHPHTHAPTHPHTQAHIPAHPCTHTPMHPHTHTPTHPSHAPTPLLQQIKLYETFQDNHKLYMIFELCPGGDLFDRCLFSSSARCLFFWARPLFLRVPPNIMKAVFGKDAPSLGRFFFLGGRPTLSAACQCRTAAWPSDGQVSRFCQGDRASVPANSHSCYILFGRGQQFAAFLFSS